MKTAKNLIPTCTQIFQCEIENCSTCGEPLANNSYRSGRKIVQGLEGIVQIAYQHSLKSAQWLQTAPIGCTFGVDVIATLGWRRQTEHLIFTDIHAGLKSVLGAPGIEQQLINLLQGRRFRAAGILSRRSACRPPYKGDNGGHA